MIFHIANGMRFANGPKTQSILRQSHDHVRIIQCMQHTMQGIRQSTKHACRDSQHAIWLRCSKSCKAPCKVPYMLAETHGVPSGRAGTCNTPCKAPCKVPCMHAETYGVPSGRAASFAPKKMVTSSVLSASAFSKMRSSMCSAQRVL